VSFVVQTEPSLQGAELLTWAQPEPGLHESSVHGLLSLQFKAEPGRQDPPEQVSFAVQALPSLQGAELSVWAQPEPGLQESSVQGFPSAQSRGGPPTHAPPEQASFVVQTLPSLHGAELFV
jgi:hypothetical protein